MTMAESEEITDAQCEEFIDRLDHLAAEYGFGLWLFIGIPIRCTSSGEWEVIEQRFIFSNHAIDNPEELKVEHMRVLEAAAKILREDLEG